MPVLLHVTFRSVCVCMCVCLSVAIVLLTYGRSGDLLLAVTPSASQDGRCDGVRLAWPSPSTGCGDHEHAVSGGPSGSELPQATRLCVSPLAQADGQVRRCGRLPAPCQHCSDAGLA